MFAFVADEHVPTPAVRALRSNGYDVSRVREEFGSGTSDRAILEGCREDGRVLLTNDSDFAGLAAEVEQPGIVIYTDQTLPPRDFVRAIIRIDDAYDALDGQLEWLEGWL